MDVRIYDKESLDSEATWKNTPASNGGKTSKNIYDLITEQRQLHKKWQHTINAHLKK